MPISTPTFAEAAASGADALLKALDADRDRGLDAKEHLRRLEEFGHNEIARRKKTVQDILVRQLSSPFVYLLLAAAAVAALTGERIDAGMIVLFTLINTVLGFTQEYHAEKAVEVLMKYWQDRTHTLRDGKIMRIESRELVPGDIVRLQAGDRIPADVRFLAATNATVDESVLTGESVSVAKDAEALPRPPGDYYEASNIGFSGTTLLTGEADAVVFATGKRGALGEIAKLTTETKSVSVFEREIAGFSGFILKLVVITLAFVFALNVGLKGVGRIEELVLFSIALTVGVIPEALPVVSTIALSRGALRMARKHVIVKRLSAIDDLGSIDILCTDKTGTITKNALHVADVFAEDEEECLRLGLFGSSFLGEKEKQQNNAFDAALWKHAPPALRRQAQRAKKIAELPFDPVRRRNTVMLETADGERLIVSRGAPDELLPLCTDIPDQIALGRHLATQGLSGNRVIVVAARRNVPAGLTLGEKEERDLAFAGVISFHDPLKEDAVAAAGKAKVLGVQIKILTGDSKEVAGAVAQKLHLIHDPLDVITGAEFDALPSQEQHEALERYHVFARVNPRQKFTLLSLLQEKNAVGFLGEGFNDAPGLKMANVGLAVEGASDIAKESADVILLNRNLSVIFDGIEEGRRTYANTIKYLKITLASNFGNFYAVAVASLFIDYLPMLPLQILLLNLLTDFPMIAIAADTVDVSELKKPSKYDVRGLVISATFMGLVSTLFDFTTFALFAPHGEHELQSIWFTVSCLTEIGLIYCLRTGRPFYRGHRPARSLAILSVVAAVLAVAIPFTAIGRDVFKFTAPPIENIAMGFAIVALYLVASEIVKSWLARTPRTSAARAA